MRKTFRKHPEFVFRNVSGEDSWAYNPMSNQISLGAVEGFAIGSLVHELTHWAMTAFLDKKELIDNKRKYEGLREGVDILTFCHMSIEERTAFYVEEQVCEH